MRVALIVMPWADIATPPLGVASLKAYLSGQGIRTDCFNFNLTMFRRVGNVSHLLAGAARWGLWSEWFFSYHLFGPKGSGELPHTLQQVQDDPFFRRLMSETGISLDRLRILLEQDIPEFLDECLNGVRWPDYDLIGFSSVFWSHLGCLALSKRVKARYPRTKIVLGGHNLEADMGIATLEACDWLDYVVDGEGEEALLALARGVAEGRPYEPIPRVSYRQASQVIVRDPHQMPVVGMDRLPTPDHSDYFKELDRSGRRSDIDPQITFETGRGCWWGEKQHCTFCGLNRGGMSFRSKSPEAILREILELCRTHHVLRFLDTSAILDLNYFHNLIPQLGSAREQHRLYWQIRFDTKTNITPDQVAALAGAGAETLEGGVESFSTPILKLIRKGVSGIQNVRFLKACARHGVRPLYRILWGIPGEDISEYGNMEETALSLTHLQPPYFQRVIPQRFSPYHFDWERLGSGRPHAHPTYRYLYPQCRFRLEDIAYYFEIEPLNPDIPPPPHVSRFRHIVKFWNEVWPENFFAYRQGPDFMEIYDSRPLRLGEASECRKYRLGGWEEFVFTLCEDIQTAEGLRRACRERDPGFSGENISSILDEMVERRWILREGNFYMNLAVPVSCLPHGQRLSLERLRQERQERSPRGLLLRPEKKEGIPAG